MRGAGVVGDGVKRTDLARGRVKWQEVQDALVDAEPHASAILYACASSVERQPEQREQEEGSTREREREVPALRRALWEKAAPRRSAE
jgi:hypothetical protein